MNTGNTVSIFQRVTSMLLGIAQRDIVVTAPDGTFKYACKSTSGVFPRESGSVNSYDQQRTQFTHPAAAGIPEKFDTLIVDSVPRAIEEVRPQRVGDVIVNYRIIVKG